MCSRTRENNENKVGSDIVGHPVFVFFKKREDKKRKEKIHYNDPNIYKSLAEQSKYGEIRRNCNMCYVLCVMVANFPGTSN